MTTPRPQHPLDAVCACSHAAWLHTTRCVAQVPSLLSQMAFKACECARGLGEFRMTVPAHHTAAEWASRPRRLEEFTVKSVKDHGDSLEIHMSTGWTFVRSKADLGRDITVGETLWQETIQLTRITGLRDANGWLFRLTNEDLAREAREFSENMHRKDVVRLEQNRKKYAAWEADLPDWLQARIRRFRDAGGEKFLLEGWGYELIICQLADLFDRGLDDAADQLANDQGASGNQWDCAKLLARGRNEMGDEVGLLVPSGISPITGSADYS
jgi:hypothetical protein